MRIRNLLDLVLRNEKYLFLLFTIANMGPIFMGIFFPSLDGAAHLYNSTLLMHMLMGDEHGVGEFVRMNPDPIPNLSGHLFLGVLNVFLPGWLTEKLLLVLYLAGLPYVFRSLLKNLGASNPLLSYLIFPFCWSFTFYLGFYNFSLALVLMLATLSSWIRMTAENIFSLKQGLKLFGLLLLTYFSHVMVFGILGMLLGFHLLAYAIANIYRKSNLKETFIHFAKRSGVLLLTSLPMLILAQQYFHKRDGTGKIYFYPKEELTEWLYNMRPLIAIDFAKEEPYTKLFLYLLCTLFILGIASRIVAYFQKNKKDFGHRIADYFLPAAIIMLILFYTLPDMNFKAGYVSVRMAYLFFLFLAVWIAVQPIGRIGGIICLLVVTICSVGLHRHYLHASRDMGRIAKSVYSLRDQVKAGSVVLPVNFSPERFTLHLSNYLGAEKPVILLENYELATGYFPLLWNNEEMPSIQLPGTDPGTAQCMDWRSGKREKIHTIDHVLILEEENTQGDSCRIQLMEQIRTHYNLKDKNKYWSLYQLSH